MPREALDFLHSVASRFGAPAKPVILRDQQIGDHIMEKKQYDNSGICFETTTKTPATTKTATTKDR
jgi:hypothetical protein